MAKVGCNDPCPCGSGAKSKRCCGTREAQALLARQDEALEELFGLAQLFPRLRPRGDAFAAWAERVAAIEVGRPELEEGLALLEPAECERIAREHAQEFPQVWRSLVKDLGDESLARQAVVLGAIAAGAWECRPPDPATLELVEDSSPEDPSEALALVLEAGDLWSVYESSQADAALAAIPDELDNDVYERLWDTIVAAQARRLATQWHRKRLAELVSRLRERLPLDGYPAASAALAAGCAAFEHDRALRGRLAADLLGESLRWTRVGLLAA